MALEQIHVKGFCILGVQTKFILQNKSIVRAIPCLGKTHTKLYTLFRTERSKPIPCPVAHPLIGHITESPLPPPPLRSRASINVFSPVLDFLANWFSGRFPLSWRCQDILFWRTARPEVSAAPSWKLFFLVAVFLGELSSKKKKIIVNVNSEKQECFRASLAGLPLCVKALGYFLRCIKRVYRQYVIGSSREERE